jgi:hypothetical protein
MRKVSIKSNYVGVDNVHTMFTYFRCMERLILMNEQKKGTTCGTMKLGLSTYNINIALGSIIITIEKRRKMEESKSSL